LQNVKNVITSLSIYTLTRIIYSKTHSLFIYYPLSIFVFIFFYAEKNFLALSIIIYRTLIISFLITKLRRNLLEFQ